MKTTIECAYCDGKAHLKREARSITYRKEVFKINAYYYKCDKCEEEFSTDEVDTVSVNQAHNQYRERHGIPFIEEIIAIRAKYGVSAVKMSEILGLGVNGYSNYENGEIPTPVIGNFIRTAGKPIIFQDLLERAKESLSESSYLKIKAKVDSLLQKEVAFPLTSINVYTEPNIYTGYRTPDVEKLRNILVYLVRNCQAEYNDRLKLNKLLFYIDFGHYKSYGYSISGISYRAIKYGPVPSNFDNIFTLFEDKGILVPQWMRDHRGAAREIFETSEQFDESKFSPEELETIVSITNKFKNSDTWSIVDLSHEEKAWIELNNQRKLISYQDYAFELIGV